MLDRRELLPEGNIFKAYAPEPGPNDLGLSPDANGWLTPMTARDYELRRSDPSS